MLGRYDRGAGAGAKANAVLINIPNQHTRRSSINATHLLSVLINQHTLTLNNSNIHSFHFNNPGPPRLRNARLQPLIKINLHNIQKKRLRDPRHRRPTIRLTKLSIRTRSTSALPRRCCYNCECEGSGYER